MPRITKRKHSPLSVLRRLKKSCVDIGQKLKTRVVPFVKKNRKITVIVSCVLVVVITLIVVLSCLPKADKSVVTESTATEQPTGYDWFTTATPSPTRVAESNVRSNYRATASGGYLPVYKKVDTMEKLIVVTVVGCTNASNLADVVDTAAELSIPLTIFPQGEDVSTKSYVAETLLKAMQNGCEIENGSYSSGELYSMTDAEATTQLTEGQAATCRALGKNIPMHFFATADGNDRYDRRTHVYLDALGYDAVVYRTYSLSSGTSDEIKSNLAPGNIYELRCSSTDASRLKIFAEYATLMGYRFVTMNDMLGYDEQVCTDLSGTDLTFPQMPTYEIACETTYSSGWYSYDIYLIQQALASGGYIDHEPTGYYGKLTIEAIKNYQTANQLTVDGIAGPEVQCKLFGKVYIPETTTASPTVSSGASASNDASVDVTRSPSSTTP